ncbi:hypothetical protein ACVBEG_02900 [Pseudomonas sp. GG8]
MNNDKIEASRELLPCPFCGNKCEERTEQGWFACSSNDCPAWHLQALAEDWNKRAAQYLGEPVAHLAFEDTFYGTNGPEVGDFDIQYDHEACEKLAKAYPGQQVALYAEQSAPVAVDAAKAFAKGFNTLEQAGGKYRINMQFANRDDAWAAYGALSKLNNSLNTK